MRIKYVMANDKMCWFFNSLPSRTIKNMWEMVLRIYISILGLTGLRQMQTITTNCIWHGTQNYNQAIMTTTFFSPINIKLTVTFRSIQHLTLQTTIFSWPPARGFFWMLFLLQKKHWIAHIFCISVYEARLRTDKCVKYSHDDQWFIQWMSLWKAVISSDFQN